MKFKLIEIVPVESKFGTYNEYTLQSLDEKHTRTTSSIEPFKGEDREVGAIVETYYEHWTKRLHRRLEKLGVNIEMGCNYPWIYLDKVNGVKVKDTCNSRHGFCIGYHTQLYPSFKKDLFEKIREIV